MIKWIKTFIETDTKTKWFHLQWILYGAIIVGGALYTYARLDYVRSGPKTEQIQTEHGNSKT
jgi:TRAP-type mannitol/chloroaromatic compound transport system permease small subunit